MKSIATVGVKQALTVYLEDGTLYLSDGHRRLAAALLAIKNGAEIKSVPVQTEGRFADEAERVLSMLVRNSGEPLKPLEAARVYKRLGDLGWTTRQISDATGVTDTRVRQTLDLLTLPTPVREHIARGDIAADTAVKVTKRVGPDKAKATIEKGLEKAKAAGRTKTMAKDMVEELTGVPAKGKSKETEERKMIGHARTAPFDLAESRAEGMEPKEDDISAEMISEPMTRVLETASWWDDCVTLEISHEMYDKLCNLFKVSKRVVDPKSED